MKKVLLINMPFSTVTYPSLAISLLKARLCENGIDCDTKHLNIVFAEMIGLDTYEAICLEQNGGIFFGERIFAQEYFGKQIPSDEKYISFLKQCTQTPGDYSDHYIHIKGFVKPFIELCIESITWEQYDIVGFSTMFEQNLASIVLASHIKRLYKNKTIVFGGANCEREMGLELHRNFPFIDIVCSGEGDLNFPELVKRILKKQSTDNIQGIIYRKNGKSIVAPELAPVRNLDTLPYPDFDDYFLQLSQSSFPSSTCTELQMETSRGCWWGEKSRCTFCGLNGYSISYRSKGEDRVVNELTYLMDKYMNKYNIPQISMVDNILDMKYFKELLPKIKEINLNRLIFWETKSNLNKEQVQLLYEAGITYVQPGIESLSTHVLKLMKKGVSVLQNIQFLKDCKQIGVYPSWNIIFGFPEEKIEDYKQMLELINKITHLQPPDQLGPFMLQRFSPYFNNPEKFGITNVSPKNAYRFVYPYKDSNLFNLAYYFKFDFRDDVKPPDYDKELTQTVNYWRQCFENHENLYSYKKSPSVSLIVDERQNAVIPQIILESFYKDTYEYCDRIHSFPSIFSRIRKRYNDYPVRERDLKDFLEEMVSLNLMVREGDRYLSLAISLDEKQAAGYR